MAWAGGTFTRANGANEWVTDFANGVGIEPARHDTQDNDLATGINQCLNKDGSNSMTGNLNLNNNIPTNIGAGTAAAPAICAGGDVNTGIFSPAADQIGIATNGTERVRIDASGKAGIGTTTPVTRVEVAETTNATNILTMSNSSNGAVATSAVYFKSDTGNPASFIVQNSSGNTTLGGASSMNIGTNGATPVSVVTNGTQRMFFSSGQNIAIGTNTAPAVLVDAQRDANDSLTRFRVYNANSGSSAQTQIDIGNNTNQSAVALFLNSSTNTGFAGTNAFHVFNGVGVIRARAGSTGGVDLAVGATSWAAVSDSRLKKNVQPLSYGLTEVLQLQPVRFDYLEDLSDDSKRLGFIAQDVKPIIPEAVSGSEDTFYGFSAAELIPALVNAIKQLEARVAELEK